jgi:PII-like signaling protein
MSELQKVSVYFGERKRAGGRLVADALLDLYAQHEIAVSALLRGVEGFGHKHQLRTDSSLSLSEDLPAVAIAVDTADRIATVRTEITAIAAGGLVTVAPIGTGAAAAASGARLTVYLGRSDRIGPAPAYIALCDLLRRREIDGATALLGVDGTVRGVRERARFFSRNARVPMMLTVVGTVETLERVAPELAALLPHAMITIEGLQVSKRDGSLLARPRLDIGSKVRLTIYSSESALIDGVPIHRALVRRLRAGGAGGATTLRGVWGFHGDHAPHGDRVLQLGRRVPMVTTVIGTARQMEASFAIVDELTAEQGLVTFEVVTES